MSNPKFAEIHNLVAFLEKPKESDGFEEIIDFLNASSVQYALTVNPIIYTTCIEQIWTSAKAKTVNGERQIQALVDKKKVIVTETSIMSNLKLDDAEVIDCLPTATIFAELERMGYENLTQKLTFYKAYFSSQWKFLIHTILQCLSAKTTSWTEFSSTMASAIIYLATNKIFNFSKYIFDNMVKNLEGGGKISYVSKKVFANMKRSGKGFFRKVTPLFETMMVQATKDMGEDSAAPTDSHSTPIHTQPSLSKPQKKKSKRKQRKDISPTEPIPDEATNEKHVATPSCDPHQSVLALETTKSNQALDIESLKRRVKSLEKRRKSRTSGLKRLRKGKKIADLDADAEVTFIDETQDKYDEEILFDVQDDIQSQEVVAEKEVSIADPVTTAGEVVTTANVEVTIASALTTTIDELTLA
ncbi:hypothetical protein Tco_0445386 [Tanacetum coccineum]